MTAAADNRQGDTFHPNSSFAPGAGLLRRFFDRLIHVGRIGAVLDNGRVVGAGTVPPDDPSLDVLLRLKGRWSPLLLALDPEYRLGELYRTGKLSIEQGSLDGLMEIVGRNLEQGERLAGWVGTALRALSTLMDQGNNLFLARHYSHFHYDLPLSMYRAFLDRDMQYSCGYFEDPNWSIEEAQRAKKLHIAAKLDLEPGQHVLDIGSGWGGLALTLARFCDVQVTGVTLSPEQVRIARERARAEGLSDRVSFELGDYREIQGQFDRVVSVGMLEHVGRGLFDQYFTKVRRLLTPDGVALIHCIGRKDYSGGENRWIRKHIFPGGYIPRLSELTAAVERTGMWIADVEILRLHYAETLRQWRSRFTAHCRNLLDEDPRFYRSWEYYLASCEMAFRHYGLMVMQLQLTRDVAALPTTRNYVAADEERLRARQIEAGRLAPREFRS